MARNLTCSARGTFLSLPRARTRRLKSSQLSSRLIKMVSSLIVFPFSSCLAAQLTVACPFHESTTVCVRPGTQTASSTRANGPFCSRYSRMALARLSPTPGRVHSAESPAVFRSTSMCWFQPGCIRQRLERGVLQRHGKIKRQRCAQDHCSHRKADKNRLPFLGLRQMCFFHCT